MHDHALAGICVGSRTTKAAFARVVHPTSIVQLSLFYATIYCGSFFSLFRLVIQIIYSIKSLRTKVYSYQDQIDEEACSPNDEWPGLI